MGPIEYWNYIMEECHDPRTRDWFLVHSPYTLLFILCSYYYFVRFCGPSFMKNREAYTLKTYIKFYNVFQIIVNAVLGYAVLTSGWLTNYHLGCQLMDPSPTGEGYRMASALWWVYMVKLIDLSETVVFVLRKKTNQISFLHVYHHITTAIVMWISIKFMPGGMFSFAVIVNSIVHVIMYSYYLLSTGGSMSQRVAGWIKPWITIIQMTQFCILLIHQLQGFLPSCEIPKFGFVILVSDLLINFYLFYDFYKKSYKQKKKRT